LLLRASITCRRTSAAVVEHCAALRPCICVSGGRCGSQDRLAAAASPSRG
jgi:hypothetical protein